MVKTVRVIMNMDADEFELPADAYALSDCADRLHNPNGIMFTILAMPPSVAYRRASKGGLAELNLLAEKLAAMEDWQMDAFIGLTAMTEPRPEAADLIDLAMNVDKCQVLYEIKTDTELGRFYVDNELYELPEGVPKTLYDYLDYDKIGRECRQREDGVFVGDCYVLKMEPLEQLYDSDRPPELVRPAAPFLLTFGLGPLEEGDLVVTLKLPAYATQIKTALEQIDGCCMEECACHQLHGVLPQAKDWLYDMSSFDTLNQLAANIRKIMNHDDLPQYKAMLEATQCADLETALLLSRQTEEYILTANVLTPQDAAVDELRFLLGADDAQELIPFVDLYNYGNKVLENCNAMLTAYGQINRTDYQPMQAPEIEPEPEQNMNQQM